MNTGEKIKYLRINAGMTQEELGKIAQTTKQNIYKYENGIITNIPAVKIGLIAKALNTTPAYLMGWEDINTEERKSLEKNLSNALKENKILQDFFDKLKDLPDDKQTEILETAIFLAEKTSQKYHK